MDILRWLGSKLWSWVSILDIGIDIHLIQQIVKKKNLEFHMTKMILNILI